MIRIKDVKIRVDLDNVNIRLKKISKLLKINEEDILEVVIKKQSIDARKKNEIYYVYDFLVSVKKQTEVLKKVNSNFIYEDLREKYQSPKKGNVKIKDKIVIVGSGPAGLFASYFLLKEGYKTLIIEQGKMVEDRIKDVERFWDLNILDVTSNVQFGEGGAGTFSDGKLNTLIKDKDNLKLKIFEIFVEHGAPPEILYVSNPHIGTDLLRTVIKNMRKSILEMGGEIRYQTKLTDLIIENKRLKEIVVNDKERIKTSNLILAIGNSARDTFEMLNKNGIEMESKPFAVGVRIMHPRYLIDENQYGKFQKYLGAANYKLTYKASNGRGVYSFCMCPGGYVINASSENKRLVVNGMSNYKRDSLVSNSAIVVTVNKDDYGDSPLDGVSFQRDLEEKAYRLGKGLIPIQRLIDFKNNCKSLDIEKSNLALKGKYELVNLREILPSYISDAFLEAIDNFDKKIKGFGGDNIVLAGIETRTSSPLRIIRDLNYECNIKGIYPIGEGAGYAGGITSSAVDGVKVARSLIARYKP